MELVASGIQNVIASCALWLAKAPSAFVDLVNFDLVIAVRQASKQQVRRPRKTGSVVPTGIDGYFERNLMDSAIQPLHVAKLVLLEPEAVASARAVPRSGLSDRPQVKLTGSKLLHAWTDATDGAGDGKRVQMHLDGFTRSRRPQELALCQALSVEKEIILLEYTFGTNEDLRCRVMLSLGASNMLAAHYESLIALNSTNSLFTAEEVANFRRARGLFGEFRKETRTRPPSAVEKMRELLASTLSWGESFQDADGAAFCKVAS